MAKVENCIFCNPDVVRQGLLYEDDFCMVLLDKYPVSKGHVLVIPKEHFSNMLVTPDDTIEDIFVVAKNVGNIISAKLHPDGMNITTNIGRAAGQAIMHFHVHVIPRYESTENLAGRSGMDDRKEIQENAKQELIAELKMMEKKGQ